MQRHESHLTSGFCYSAAQLSQISFVTGTAGTSDDLYEIATDGQAFSGSTWANFHATNV